MPETTTPGTLTVVLTDSFVEQSVRGQVSPMKFVFMAYFVMCGGPFGMEEAVGKAYPLLALSFIVFLPFFYAIPLALVTSELGCMFPTNDGMASVLVLMNGN